MKKTGCKKSRETVPFKTVPRAKKKKMTRRQQRIHQRRHSYLRGRIHQENYLQLQIYLRKFDKILNNIGVALVGTRKAA